MDIVLVACAGVTIWVAAMAVGAFILRPTRARGGRALFMAGLAAAVVAGSLAWLGH